MRVVLTALVWDDLSVRLSLCHLVGWTESTATAAIQQVPAHWRSRCCRAKSNPERMQ